MDAIESRCICVSASLLIGRGFVSNKGIRGAEVVRVPVVGLEFGLRGDVGVEGNGLEMREFSRPEVDCVRLEPMRC